jgi:arsenite methyltransferase
MSNCSPDNNRAMEEDIRSLYTRLALHSEQEFGWGRGKENARGLGYDGEWLERLPEVIWESSAAVGNPFSIGPIRPGETVIDLGCGAGADVCVAALLVGPRGHVIGVDVTPAMVEKALGWKWSSVICDTLWLLPKSRTCRARQYGFTSLSRR